MSVLPSPIERALHTPNIGTAQKVPRRAVYIAPDASGWTELFMITGLPTTGREYVITITPRPGTEPPGQVRAMIEWGGGGGNARVILDATRGVAVRVSGSSFKVSVTYMTTNGATDFASLLVSAWIAEGTGAAGTAALGGPTFTDNSSFLGLIPAPAIAALGLFQTDVLPYGRSFRFARFPRTAPFTVQFQNEAGNPIEEVAVLAGANMPFVDIPDGTVNILVTNGAVAIDQFDAIQGLNL